ncbi:MAG: hypothetical protein R3E79_18660 [Caldilineaceae bacterium]
MFKQLIKHCTQLLAAAGILTTLLLPSAASAEAPLTATFTYQGQLRNGSSAVNGDCDFQFSLWSVPLRTDAADQVGAVIPLTLRVTNGLFTAQLNSGGEFGSTAFTGEQRWLQTAVRCPAGSGDFTTLAPRQELTATPYALSLKPGAQVIGAEKLGVTVITSSDSDNGNAAIYGRQGEGNGGPRFIGAGVWGDSNHRIGVAGTSNDYIGLYGYSNSDIGIFGVTYGPQRPAIEGRHDTATGTGPGVSGVTESADSEAVGVLGVVEPSAAGGYSAGVRGVNNSTTGNGIGVWGEQKGSGWGVYGWAPQGYGVYGNTYSGAGVYGRAEKVDGSGVVAENAAVDGTALRINTGAIRNTGAGVGTATPIYIHDVGPGNLCYTNFASVLDNPYANNDAGALLFVTPVSLPGSEFASESKPVSVMWTGASGWYDCPANHWVLLAPAADGVLAAGMRYNVMVIKP